MYSEENPHPINPSPFLWAVKMEISNVRRVGGRSTVASVWYIQSGSKFNIEQQNKGETYVWAKGYSRFKGNGIVDTLAKEAAVSGVNIPNLTHKDIISSRKSMLTQVQLPAPTKIWSYGAPEQAPPTERRQYYMVPRSPLFQ
ncbi:unnamed protein product [Acanthoscelides obtectus]|uniref:Uncharacterized protein n=1 Tax=Acanthoscelides obtectus TaxID=200917 RepID=A0A9P0L446_ACAOB|nr:unnamed protein product [Acanthoscelides obtectus]CAK1662484.1 hypothetical protein AOBTE_LOCUS23167 [Acanthoscelides obtectus]